MSFWKKFFGKNENNKEIIVAIVVENDLKIFKNFNDATRYLTDNKMDFALNRISELKSKSETQRNVKAIKINENNEIIEYPNLQKLKEDQPKN